MGSTVEVLVALVRNLIPEVDPIEWTNVRLATYLDREYQEWAAELGKLPGPGWFTMVKDFTLTANTTTVNLSTFIDPTTVGFFAAIKSCWYLPETGRKQRIDSVAPGNEEDCVLEIGASAYGQQKPRGRWLTRPAGVPTLNFGPTANVDISLRAYIRYKPPTLGYGASQQLQTDPRHDDVLVLGTALRALLDSSETDPTIQSRYNYVRGKFLEDERMAAGEFESETTKMTGVSEEMFQS